MRKETVNTESLNRVTEWWGCTDFPKCKGYLNPQEAKWMLGKQIRREKRQVVRQERTKQSIEAIRKNLSKKSHINYYQYINSPEWRQKSEEAKKRARYRCQVCNKSSWEAVLNTHHRTYERLGFEMEEDLVVLCGDCHSTFHKNGKIVSYKKKYVTA
jgi:ssDNA-binding Zn-finger/Zn-ribbon topoisomerase 1